MQGLEERAIHILQSLCAVLDIISQKLALIAFAVAEEITTN